MTQSVQQEVTFAAPPSRVYQALMDSAQHAAFTGGAAEISTEVGGAFSCHNGQIVGRNIELAPDRRIVQAWRVAGWPEGVYSVVRFELAGDGPETRLTLTHAGLPEGASEMIDQGWKSRYWEPLRKHLA